MNDEKQSNVTEGCIRQTLGIPLNKKGDEMKEDNKYNGWSNYETWNVALWIGNDEGLYNLAKECKDYAEFREQMEEINHFDKIAYRSPDGVAWNDSGLDVRELDELITDLREDG